MPKLGEMKKHYLYYNALHQDMLTHRHTPEYVPSSAHEVYDELPPSIPFFKSQPIYMLNCFKSSPKKKATKTKNASANDEPPRKKCPASLVPEAIEELYHEGIASSQVIQQTGVVHHDLGNQRSQGRWKGKQHMHGFRQIREK